MKRTAPPEFFHESRLLPYIPAPGTGWLGLLQAHLMNAAVLFLYVAAVVLAWRLATA